MLSVRHMIWICIPSTDYLCSDVYRLKRAFQKLSPTIVQQDYTHKRLIHIVKLQELPFINSSANLVIVG